MTPSRLEVMRSLEPRLAEALPTFLRSVDSSWQPMDFMPDLGAEAGIAELRALREEAAALPGDTIVVLTGDMITEEALPSYASWISALEGPDVQGEPANAWGAWNRGWCAEENRHGDILNRYLYLSGRTDMRAVETTIQHLIRDGGDIGTENDPFRTFVYTSFQEIATRVSHLNVGQLARKAGAERLFALSKRVAGDEQRHARAYMQFVSWIFELDPSAMMLAFADMMRKKITMPAMYMRESANAAGDTFRKFEAVAERTGVYTVFDYIGIIEHLLEAWQAGAKTGLSPEAEAAQDYVCRLPGRHRRIAERRKPRSEEPLEFTWLRPPAPGIAAAG